MEYHPEPVQVLLLWKLATSNGAAWKADIKPAHITDKGKRDSLVRYGLISEQQQKREIPGKRATRGLFFTLEEKGWAWLADHLDAPLSRSAAAADVLQSVLKMLQSHLSKHRMVLADFIDSEEENASEAVADVPATDVIADGIVTAYRSLSDDRSNGRVRLKDLRRKLSDVPREQLDLVLNKMTREGVIVLNRLDNPREITPEDDAAKLVSPLGDPRHIMHMEIPAHV